MNKLCAHPNNTREKQKKISCFINLTKKYIVVKLVWCFTMFLNKQTVLCGAKQFERPPQLNGKLVFQKRKPRANTQHMDFRTPNCSI